MRVLLSLAAVTILSGCATLTQSKMQEIAVTTTPDNAICHVSNIPGDWVIDGTPGTVKVRRSYSDLNITCTAGDAIGRATVEAETSDRAWWNIALLGVPVIIDAMDGYGFQYEKDNIFIELAYQPKTPMLDQPVKPPITAVGH